jgi:flavorubredoxin
MPDTDVLFSAEGHQCLRFANLVEGEGIQSNQFLITHGDHAAVLDPGGDLTYTPLSIALSRLVNLQKLDYVLASHQDPDIIASLPKWLMHTECQVVVSRLWSRFLPHLSSSFVTGRLTRQLEERILALPDEGLEIAFGDSSLMALPAHFLHSVGNFSFYDPVSRILFSGDIGASLGGEEGEVSDFARHRESMVGFHRRYMASGRVCRLWAAMVRDLAPAMIVPQHGGYFTGDNVEAFLGWLEALECGADLMERRHYQAPKKRI